MNGLEGPSTAELAKRLEKRINLAQFPKYDKRFNRNGVNKVPSGDGGVGIKGANTLVSHHHGDGDENSSSGE